MSNPSFLKNWIFWAVLAIVALIIYIAGSALTPFVISLAIAYILDPLVDRLEALGLPRTGAIFFFLFGISLIFALGILFLFPIIKLQVETMAKSWPECVNTDQGLSTPWVAMFSNDPEKLRTLAHDIMLKLGNLPLKAFGSVAVFLWETVSGFVNFTIMAINLIIIPVATFYLLRDIDEIKKKAVELIPVDIRDYVLYLSERLHTVLSNFIRGQMMVVCILSVIYCTGLFLCGIPLSLPIGILAGLANIVPFMGLILGFIPALVLSYLQFHDVFHPLLVCLVFGIAQALEGMIITPKIVGDKLGLHPVVIMLSVLLGGKLFGFAGILLSVPVAAAINVFWTEWLKIYKHSEIYLGTSQAPDNNK